MSRHLSGAARRNILRSRGVSVGKFGRLVRIPLTVAVAGVASLAAAVPAASPASAASSWAGPQLALPVPFGATVNASGPHYMCGTACSNSPAVLNSVDLGYAGDQTGTMPVLAAAGGVVTFHGDYAYDTNGNRQAFWQNCWASIDHPGGWRTTYYHLRNANLALNGTTVSAGTQIALDGFPNKNTCGDGNVAHVHFSVWTTGSGPWGSPVAIDGMSIGGYTVHGGTQSCGYGGSSYYGSWSRNSDGAAVVPPGCFERPRLVNNILAPNPPTPPAMPTPGGLLRYVGGAYHFVSTLGAPAGYSFETSVGQVSMVSEPNTHPLFSCMNGSSDQFVSPDSNCEGQKGLGLIGFAFNSAPSGVPSVLLERCIVTGNNSHFVSNDPNCEGQRPEGSLGYAIGYASVGRYVGGAYHFVSTLGAPAGYSFETSVGQVSMVSEPNTHPLFSCMNGSSDQFVSPDSNCEGQKGLGLIGFAFNSAPSGVPSVLLERCIVTGNNSHLVSNDPNCEGQRPEGSLGYALASLA